MVGFVTVASHHLHCLVYDHSAFKNSLLLLQLLVLVLLPLLLTDLLGEVLGPGFQVLYVLLLGLELMLIGQQFHLKLGLLLIRALPIKVLVSLQFLDLVSHWLQLRVQGLQSAKQMQFGLIFIDL